VLLSPLRKILASIVLVVVVVVVWFVLQVFPVGGSGHEALVTVHQGDSMSTIAGELHRAGVMSSSFAFRVDSLLQGAPLVRPGDYEIPQGADFPSIISILNGGPNVPQIDVTPGLTLHEIVLNLAGDMGNTYAESFLADATQAASTSAYQPHGSLEGLIGPGLYLITPGETPAQLLAAMRDAFDQEAAAAGLSASSDLEGLSAYQLIIAASIVEKEGYYPKNMPDVARVIFNRLARDMPLQMDSTILYALQRDGGTVTHAMLQTPSPYNTYLNLGLTPTPICVVSPQALAAVLHAPAGTWLYFVLVDKAGDMAFSTTFAQQLANEAIAAKAGV
jgi:UPF0755 protein